MPCLPVPRPPVPARRNPAAALSALALALSLGLGLAPAAGAQQPSFEQTLAEIQASRLDTDGAVELASLTLDLGGASFRVEKGRFFPVRQSSPDGRIQEMVFVGQGRLRFEPPDDIEAGQLELFTDAPDLDQEVTEAVFAFGNPAPTRAIFSRAGVTPEAGEAEAARQLWEAWKASSERRLLGVEPSLLQAALGDALQRGFVTARLKTAHLGNLLYVVDQAAQEQVTLGQFVPLDLTEKEQRKARKAIHRQQRQGRLIGLELEDLGAWDTWLSASLTNSAGESVPGLGAFDPERYVLDVSLDGRKLDEMQGVAKVQVSARWNGAQGVNLSLNSDLTVRSVRGPRGEDLPFHQQGGEVVVWLPAPLSAGDSTVVEVAYDGRMFEKLESGVFQLRDTLNWHPRVDGYDRATYDATFHYPDHLELVCGGNKVGEGEEGRGRLWQRRTLEIPTAGLTFELGKFRYFERQVGHVKVRVALDKLVRTFDQDTGERILDAVADSLDYYESVFGPYPLDRLEAVTTFRPYSQATLGLLTLSNLMMLEDARAVRLFDLEDFRTVIAHELAHQWWGHIIGWDGYRDQWISEALANYSSYLYGRMRLRDTPYKGKGPLHGWQEALFADLESGRTVESIGPVVLGSRLASTKAGDAYFPITYLKGALVFNMLARQFGEEPFLKMLAAIAEHRAYADLSTEEFLEALEQVSGKDLDSFAEQFVYGTGLPEVYYDYRFYQDDAGTWRVAGEARLSSSYHYRYRTVRHEQTGRLDVARDRIEHLKAEQAAMVVPFRLSLWNPEAEIPKGKKKAEAKEEGNQLIEGRLQLEGAVTEWDLELPGEPKRFWLDAGKEVLGRFFDERRHPKRMLYYQALDKGGSGEFEEALDLTGRALDAPYLQGDGEEDVDKDDTEWLDGLIHFMQARLHLDAGRPADARASLEKARNLLRPGRNEAAKPMLEVLEARLDLQEGEADRAYRSLRKRVLKREDADSTEAWLLLAIAAEESGHTRERAEAVEEAERRGADVKLLVESR